MKTPSLLQRIGIAIASTPAILALHGCGTTNYNVAQDEQSFGGCFGNPQRVMIYDANKPHVRSEDGTPLNEKPLFNEVCRWGEFRRKGDILTFEGVTPDGKRIMYSIKGDRIVYSVTPQTPKKE
ncbi:hypothetical protein HYW76_04070 [Candidatus Pacearchaeota archaeon]|nr:hypothetical protein [Candidatus Pacearchaeota archaeon]